MWGDFFVVRNMAFLAVRRVELDIGEVHTTGGKKKKKKKKRQKKDKKSEN
jgi:hypothetical protein